MADGQFIACAFNGRVWTHNGTSWTEQRPKGDVTYGWYYCAINAEGNRFLVTDSNRLFYYNGSWAEIRPLGNADKPWAGMRMGAGTTVCKRSGGVLHKININSPGTLCTIYDNSAGSGTPVIAIIDTNKTTGNIGTLTYDCPFYNGLSIVTTGAGTDLTVIYE